MTLNGLPDTRKIRHCERFESGAEAVKWLRKKVACTAADENGALNIWDDKYGKYRCEAMRRYVVLESKAFTNFRDVRRWANEWLKKIA